MNTMTPDTLAHRVIDQRVHVIGGDDEALAVEESSTDARRPASKTLTGHPWEPERPL
ncbi:MAG: hypothetical protein WCF33_11240 [Pseudonocardiaceae bacterium]